MDAFTLLDTGFWSLVPPLLALGLALITKEVYSSLLVGVFSGLLIYEFSMDGAGISQFISAFCLLPTLLAAQIEANAALLLFLALLGALVVLITVAGGSRAYAEWVSQHIKSARTAQLMTAVLGIIIFVDDYFNCLTVGAVMRPVTDRFHISHEKLAYIIDSTAAPVCIIAPVSSWAVAVGGYLGDGGFTTFVASIPYNFYALLTIFMVFVICATGLDYGPMKQAAVDNAAGLRKGTRTHIPQRGSALEDMTTARVGDVAEKDFEPPVNMETLVAEEADLESAQNALEQFKGMNVSKKGKVVDLIVPIFVLIVFSILGMMYAGGFFEGDIDFATAIGEDPIAGLCIGSTVALCVAFAMFLPRKLVTLSGYVEAASEGIRTMVSAIMILVLAWSLGGLCRYMLGTGPFVAGILTGSGFDLSWLPMIIFIVAAFIGFAMGTSWGTIALLLPIILGIYADGDPLFLVAIGAALAGAVYGDHTSPISDTTILSSAGAECNHLRHVATQLPYASTVAVVCIGCYLLTGFTASPWLSLGLGLAVLSLVIFILVRKDRKMKARPETA